MPRVDVKTGLDVLKSVGFSSLKGRRLGLLAHQASVDSRLKHAWTLFLDAGLDLRLLFAPEHGLGGAAQDMEPIEDVKCRQTGLRVHSLYGQDLESLRPSKELLRDLDVLVIDLQDVGSRYYTFAVSMRYCMEACAQAGVRVMVLDRPNPLNGLQLEGPGLHDAYRSFVGGFPVPVRHGLTLGELAKFAVFDGVDVELEVVAMQGWKRSMWFDETGLPWVTPSPNMPTLDTATVYPGACLVEATNISEGRGTTHPFEWLGAPWLHASRLAEGLNAFELRGVRFRPISFRPGFQKHAGKICHGIQVHVTDRRCFEAFRTGLYVLKEILRTSGEEFHWRIEPYEFVSDRPAIDLLSGGCSLRDMLEGRIDMHELVHAWEKDLEVYRVERRAILIYPEEES